ncbi:Met31p KNAG_0A02260 [Huiozyma naganishii CBS 8797]|uniref:C2H2-type domain-containing protein n=1 Tax=Huiozyma naganishii (strain ATCC MYA-139 / BCRC 22969 / CBS 8797 / KCTC 17520 / NBRC 10181 / NCYC 3082 / Yp74L-3) TaxID=1071383 RepID=J7QZK6_HUIN7|nr:hypothetical protein KNAG_0A02260 [Kazachstania naganishii CBS 8797]CCK67915.1 hypothetical protein KNAG_0A02260 [Kazachstania naganishii CBS 8797]
MGQVTEETTFLRRVADALVSTKLNDDAVDPSVKELLTRVQCQQDAQVDGSPTPRDVQRAFRFDLREKSESGSSLDDSHGIPGGVHKENSTDSTSTAITDKNGSIVANNLAYAGAQDSGEKYPCAQCELEFLRPGDLRRHEKAHSIASPHICSRCGKGFARKDALKRHFNTLTCSRNRKKLMKMAGDNFEALIAKAQRDGISI